MGVSFRGMYMRNIADITPKWKDIRIADQSCPKFDLAAYHKRLESIMVLWRE